MAAAGFEQARERDQVRPYVRSGVLEGVTHAGLRRKVQHGLRAFLFHQRIECARLREVELRKPEPRSALETREPVALECDRVVRIQVVDADDLVAACEQALGAMHADKSRASGHQYAHLRQAPQVASVAAR